MPEYIDDEEIENPMPAEKPYGWGEGPLEEGEMEAGKLPFFVDYNDRRPDPIPVPVPMAHPEEHDIDATVSEVPERKTKARHFLELVNDGMPPSQAVRAVHTTMQDLRKDADVRAQLKDLIVVNRLPADIRKEMVRSGLNSLFMKNIGSDRLKDQKMALDVAKQISKDPEVGLSGPVGGPSVTIDMGSFAGLLQKMKPIEGLEDILITPTPVEDK